MTEKIIRKKNDILLSASQIILFKRCPRAWYWKYIRKEKEPFRPWFLEGRNFHGCIEHAYKKITGQEIKKQRFFDESIVDLVEIGFEKKILIIPDKFLVEHAIKKFPICDGAYLNGFIDFINISDGKIEDHKTVKSWQYAETEKTLKVNPQLLIYAYWYFSRLKKRKSVYLRHNQFHKNAPETSKFTEVKVSRKYVENYWETEVLTTAKKMVKMKPIMDEEAFEYELGACGDYGGCSFLGKCSVGENNVN